MSLYIDKLLKFSSWHPVCVSYSSASHVLFYRRLLSVPVGKHSFACRISVIQSVMLFICHSPVQLVCTFFWSFASPSAVIRLSSSIFFSLFFFFFWTLWLFSFFVPEILFFDFFQDFYFLYTNGQVVEFFFRPCLYNRATVLLFHLEWLGVPAVILYT